MVVTLLYTYTGKEIGKEIGTEQAQRCKIREKQYILFAFVWGLKACLYFGSVWFGLVWFGLVQFGSVGSDFCPSIKKFFNFPNFFANYLIFNAFQI